MTSAFDELLQLCRSWHEECCTNFGCECGDVAQEEARELHRQIIDEYEEKK